MVRKLFLFFGVAILLGGGTFILVYAQTSAPSNFAATTLSACGVKLEWDFTGTADSFVLWRDQQGTFFPAPGDPRSKVTAINILLNDPNLAISGTHYVYKSLNSGFVPGTYYYQISPVKTGGGFLWSEPDQAIVPTLLAPQPISSLDVLSESDGQQAGLTWQISSPVSTYGGFKIKRAVSATGNNLTWSDLVLDNNGNKFISSDGSSVKWDYLDGAGTSYSPFLDPTKAYSYQVSVFESGEGCGAKIAESAPFPLPDGAMIPSAPTNLAASFSYDPNNLGQPINLSWNQATKNDHFEVWRKKSDSRGSDVAFFKMANTNPAKITQTSYTDADVVANGIYQYEIRACSDAAGKYCSAYSNIVKQMLASAPRFLQASVASVSGSKATVHLAWENTFPDRNYYVERKTGNGSFVPVPPLVNNKPVAVANQPGTVSDVFYDDASVDLGQTYTWRVYAKFGTVSTKYSNEATLSLDITAIKGWAFGFTSATNDASGNIFAKGIGWLRLSNDSSSTVWGNTDLADDQTVSGKVPYGVFVDNSTGLLSGYAWSGSNFGWLGFSLSPSDLANCPDGQQRLSVGDTCQAKVDLATGKIDGWARFTSADISKGAWDGWVSLSGSNYGVCYGGVTKEDGTACSGNGSSSQALSGWAWGSEVGGWLNFGALVPPILKDPIQSSQDGTSVNLNWSNGMDYSKVDVFMSDIERNPSACAGNEGNPTKCPYINTPAVFGPDPLSKSSNGFDKSATVNDLLPGKTYGFFIRTRP